MRLRQSRSLRTCSTLHLCVLHSICIGHGCSTNPPSIAKAVLRLLVRRVELANKLISTSRGRTLLRPRPRAERRHVTPSTDSMHHPRSMRHDNTIFLRPVAFARDGKSRHRYPGGHQRRRALARICLVQLQKIRRDSRAPKTVQADLSNYMTTVNGGVSSCACRSLACMSKSLRFAGKPCRSLTDGSNIVDSSSKEPSESPDKGQSLSVRRCASSNVVTFLGRKADVAAKRLCTHSFDDASLGRS